MSKRRLTKQQQNRIKEAQEGYLLKAGDNSISESCSGTLIARYGKQVDILDEDGNVQVCTLRQNLPALVVGDEVAWQKSTESELGMVFALKPRKTELCRFNYHGEKKLVAANVTQAIITMSIIPQIALSLLDSYIAAIELNHIAVVIVFNKMDLLEEKNKVFLQQTAELYKKVGYQVCCTNGLEKSSLSFLEETLKNQTSVFIGPSGAGKSTLIKQFVEKSNIVTRAVSENTQLGRHTTTTSSLYQIKPHGVIIDSPGVRGFGPGVVEMQELYKGFIDILPYQGECKFRNCQHESEPGCALHQAVESGALNVSRLESFKKLVNGNKNA